MIEGGIGEAGGDDEVGVEIRAGVVWGVEALGPIDAIGQEQRFGIGMAEPGVEELLGGGEGFGVIGGVGLGRGWGKEQGEEKPRSRKHHIGLGERGEQGRAGAESGAEEIRGTRASMRRRSSCVNGLVRQSSMPARMQRS